MVNPVELYKGFAEPDKDAQLSQYRRMLDLTRTAANESTGLEDRGLLKNLFLSHLVAELTGLVFANEKEGVQGGLRSKMSAFESAILPTTQDTAPAREKVLESEAELLQAIHELERKTAWDKVSRSKLRRIGLLLIVVLIGVMAMPALWDGFNVILEVRHAISELIK